MLLSSRRIVGLCILLIATGQVLAADLHVPAQSSTIAAALAGAQPGDRIVVAPGHYTEHDLQLVAGVTIVGHREAPSTVIIDAQQQGRVFRAEGLDQDAVLDGLTITGGHAQGPGHYDGSGGGLLVSRSRVRLVRCEVRNNRADASGGGIRVAHGSVVLVDCLVSDNTAARGGGGLDASYGANGNALNTRFLANQGAWGGGLSFRSGSTGDFFHCHLQGNQAVGEPGLGGGLACDLESMVAMSYSVITDNTARRGGGIYTATGATPRLSQLTIDRNQAESAGGGLYCNDSSPVLLQSIVSFHEQDAIACRRDAHPTLSGCNLYGNLGGDWSGDLLFQRNTRGNMSQDPLYCSDESRNLQPGSPCAPRADGMGLVGGRGVGCNQSVPLDAPVLAIPLQMQAQPNPFNPITELAYSVPTAGRVRLTVFDVRGRRLATLVDTDQAAGHHRVRWDARDHGGRPLSSGTYLAVLETGQQRLTSKLMLLR